MLAAMRKNATNPLVLIPVGIIIFVFVFTFGQWGGSDVSGNMPMAATVNGRVISEAMFNVAYSRQYQNNQLIRRGYGIEDAKREGLKEKVLDDLVARELLAQLGEDRGLRVSDDEVVDYVKTRFFGADKPFDREEYKRIVHGYFQTSEPRFEEQVRRDILADRMENLVSSSLHVTQQELQEEFDNRFNRASLEVVRIDPLYFKELPTPSDDEVKTWADANESKIEEHYNKHINRYRKEKEVRARHILIKVDENASAGDKAKAKERLLAAKKRVDGGEDFAKVATEVSEDEGSKQSGGDLGFFGKGRMVPPFEEAAFALEPGGLSDVVESRHGYHLIKVEEVKAPEITELASVRLDIAKQLMKEDAQNAKARALAQQVLTGMKAGKQVSELGIEGLQLPEDLATTDPAKRDPFAPRVELTGWFAQNARYVPRVGVSPELATAAFALTDEQPTADQVFEVSNRFFVVRLKDRERPDPAKFEAEKETLKQGLIRARQAVALDKFLEELKAQADVEKNQALIGYAI